MYGMYGKHLCLGQQQGTVFEEVALLRFSTGMASTASLSPTARHTDTPSETETAKKYIQ